MITSQQPLEPFVPFGTELRRHYMTNGRIVLTVIMVGLMVLAFFMFEEHQFLVSAKLSDVRSLEQCKHYCEKSRLDEHVVAMVGGYGRCWHNGKSTVKFEVCPKRDDKGKPKDCVVVKSDYEPPEGSENWSTACSFKVVKPVWKPIVVMILFSVTIILIIQGFPAEVLLLGCASLFALLGIISRDDVFTSLSDKGLTQVALLFPISAAIQETGLLEKAIGVVLGTPSSMTIAVPRMMAPVAILSAFLSNTAAVAMLIPILCTWGRRLRVHPGKLLMPLSFASQLGGSMTLLGSSHCMIAKTAIAKGGKYDMGFFDLFPIGLVLCIAMMALISVLSQTSLLQSSAGKVQKEEDPESSPEVYRLPVLVNALGGIAGQSLEDSGLARVPGVVRVNQTEGGRNSAVLEEDDELLMHCSVKGVVNIRAIPGVRLKNEPDLNLLGARRRQRFLYEACVDYASELLTGDLLTDPDRLRVEFGACLVAGPKARESLEKPVVGPSSVLLLEADHRWVEDLARKRWADAFSLIQTVPNSSPIRTGLVMDQIRSYVTAAGFALIIALYTAKLVSFDVASVVYLVFLLVIQQLSLKQLLGAMKVDIIFTIAGALAMGQALSSTGIVGFLSSGLMEFAGDSYAAVVAMVYCIAVFMSMFINNSATIGILGPLILQVVQKNPDFNVKGLTWTLVFAAGSCFTTPLGYQTNLMVMPDGEYAFGDFMRFGLVIQLCHFALTVLVIVLSCGRGS